MRILVVGGKGTIGQAIVEKLKDKHELIIAGRTSGDVQVDLTSVASIEAMFNKVGHVDGIVNASGTAKFRLVEEMTPEDNLVAVQSKLLGQINLALIGQKYLRRNGSITLTTGVMKDDPVPGGASAAMANGGVQAFVKAAAIDFTQGIRINCVSPNVLVESYDKYQNSFKGFVPVPAERVAMAYVKSVEGKQTGQEYQVY
ncbi:short chain dehydrogenase [Enterococcus xiangfangensis]|uniref:Short chain dehydrogenase n=1 Tax=Enterococcus xiangfangensis TaxID=1296537 RepID=A0ABU3F8H5_9ENTE|nr:short chain dehydrogenase [Enterococcus xiangfangensis]MBM7710979.1 NAD(P)-dependent dehydrogenase (short-subunit alcohol dehydrogenase family) [Enterococcus xiangfangensis]MDT2758967.1 short chain dehydrogenase [Enterococcus xiangfangensis]